MSDVAESIRQIITEQNTEFFERSDAVLGAWLCLLTGEHGFLMGPSGTAKSALLSSITGRIDGARYWHIQLDKMLDKSDSFGQFDIARFETESIWERDYTDSFGDCHIALLDEIDKAGPASLVPYLEMLQERRFKPGKTWVHAPLVSAFGAANTSLDVTDTTLAALADRFLVRVRVGYLAEPRNFIALLESPTEPPAPTTTVTLEQLEHVRTVEVPGVTLPRAMAQAILDLRGSLLAHGIECSDRRWKAAVKLLRAHAWLAGRSEVIDDDLGALRFVLWSSPEQIPLVTATVMAARSPLTQAIDECTIQLDEVAAELAVRRTRPLAERVAWAGTAMVKVNAASERLANLGALDMQDRVETLRLSIYHDCLEGA